MRNTLVIFLVSGFWHGANWTFIVWGAYHAILFLPLMLLGINRKYTDEVAKGRLLPSVKEVVQMLSTFLLTMIGWIIFRSESITQAWDILSRICSPSLLYFSHAYGKKTLLYIFCMLAIEWLQRDKQHALQMDNSRLLGNRFVRYSLYYMLVIVILLLAGGQADFVYFQF